MRTVALLLALSAPLCAQVTVQSGTVSGSTVYCDLASAKAVISEPPASLAGYWDASTFTTDGSTKDGSNNVTRWEDKIGSRDLTVVNATPLYTASAVNGLGAIDIEQTDGDGMAVNDAGPGLPFVVYVVGQIESAAANRTLFYCGDKDVDNLHFYTLNWSGTPAAVAQTFDGSTVSTATHGSTLSTGVTYCFFGRWTSTTSRGVNVDSGTEATNTGSRTVTGADRIAFGLRYDSSPSTVGSDGFICAALMVGAVPSASEDARVKTWLDMTWEISGL